MEERVSLSRLAYILTKSRRVIVIATIGAVLVSSLVSLVLPKWYRAVASILPPETTMSQLDIGGMMRYAGYQPAFIPTLTSPSEIYAAILRSNRIRDAVVDSLDLIRVYDVRSVQAARGKLRKRATVSISTEGIVYIACEDKVRSMAARIANTFMLELDRFNRQSRSITVRKVRKFVETRLKQTEAELESAERELQRFKEETGAVLISEQTRTSIETAAGLYGKIAELEVSLERFGQFATERSPEIVDLRTRIRAHERKLAEMGYMESPPSEGTDSKLFPKFSNAPQLQKRLAGLLREVEIKRTVYGVLSEQYEEARIQEMKNTPTITVLDWAEEPVTRWRPKRKTIVMVSAAVALILSSFVVLVRERMRRRDDSRTREHLSQITNMLGSDLRGILRFFGYRRTHKEV
jgi:tyrosine-protein kinase Etk/Wzc